MRSLFKALMAFSPRLSVTLHECIQHRANCRPVHRKNTREHHLFMNPFLITTPGWLTFYHVDQCVTFSSQDKTEVWKGQVTLSKFTDSQSQHRCHHLEPTARPSVSERSSALKTKQPAATPLASWRQMLPFSPEGQGWNFLGATLGLAVLWG